VRAAGKFGWGQLVHFVEGNWYIFKIPITAVGGNWSTPVIILCGWVKYEVGNNNIKFYVIPHRTQRDHCFADSLIHAVNGDRHR